MEEKRVMIMEVEHVTLRGGKAKPSSRDEWCGAVTCISKIRQRVLPLIQGGLAHENNGWNKSVFDSKCSTLLHLVELP